MWNKTHWYFSTVSAKQREIREFSPIRKENFRAAVSEGKSWQMESPKILMLFRESPHQLCGKSPCKLLSNHVLRTKLPHIEFNSNTALLALDRKHWSRCQDAICIKHVSRNITVAGNVQTCCTALLKMTEDWRRSLDNRESAMAGAFDSSKAFDSINHNCWES